MRDFNTPEYWAAVKAGKISWEQVEADEADYEARRSRALATSGRYSARSMIADELARWPIPEATEAYCPELSAWVTENRNIYGATEKVLKKLAEYIYQRDRERREADVTKSYLANATGFCERAVQYALRQLERFGLIETSVVRENGWVVGLRIKLLNKALPRHHHARWPQHVRPPVFVSLFRFHVQEIDRNIEKKLVAESRRTLGEQPESYKQHSIYNIEPVRVWAQRCMNGAWKAYRDSLPLFDAQGLSPPLPS